ncbi:hypothetical protein SKUN_001477 [Spiroplasma kunkelii CR2-3x]|uniref:Uncharacterized protein n=1 Tax=Spiroplasma kunkelii CR2-3x TaxID=273035 RepID=A0A0K2JJD7_SPIKU|nr:hypothetical protein [Spiroplasma kunkelii]ALA98336.1 hypothetical protein SKUN_001477 [Spiroplasma kunkelii CR2-3x]
MIYNQIYELQNKIKKLLDKALAEKYKQYGILLADRDKLEMYRHNRLKKSDFYEVNHSCDLPDGGRVWIHGHMLD